jgi:hypothetical protein
MENVLAQLNGRENQSGIWGASEVLNISVKTIVDANQYGWVSLSSSSGQPIEYEGSEFALVASQYIGDAVVPVVEFDYSFDVELSPEAYDAMSNSLKNPPAANDVLKSLFQ